MMSEQKLQENNEVLSDEENRTPESEESRVQQLPVEPTTTVEASEELTEEQLKAKRINCCKKLLLASIIIGFIIFVIIDSSSTGYLKNGIKTFLDWIQRHPAAGFFAFMAVYFVATVLFVPGSLLTFGAGFVFAHEFGLGLGVVLGSISVFCGAYAGATAGFLIARFVLREWVQKLASKYAVFEALDIALAEKGFRIMTLIRLSPIIPFSATNYIAGITSLSFRDYELALFFILPGTALYVFLGASAGSLTASADSGDINLNITIPVIVVGIVLGVLAVGLTSYYAKNELNRVIEKRRAQQEAEQQQQQQQEPRDDEEAQQDANAPEDNSSEEKQEDEVRTSQKGRLPEESDLQEQSLLPPHHSSIKLSQHLSLVPPNHDS